MREIWVHADPWDKDLVTTALESGADAVIVPPDRVESVRELGRIDTVSENGDIQWDRDVSFMKIRSAEDEERVVRESRERRVILQTDDWKIIPLENPYIAPRPFRVNAGAVHAYILGEEGRTRYLSELGSGDSLWGVDARGGVRPLVVGRVKIERRPLLLVRAQCPTGIVSTICQNAETIRMVRALDHSPVSVIALEPGDEVQGLAEPGGRHFGRKIEETIQER